MEDAPPFRSPALSARNAASRARREAAVVAAKAVFFEHGYQLTSMDLIAEQAGTTKRTLYDYFGSKEALFSEVIAQASQQFVEALPRPEDLPDDPRQGLCRFANQVRWLVSGDDAIRFERTVIAEAERHPAFGRDLYDIGVVGAEKILAAYIDSQIDAGRLKAHDSRVTAQVIVDIATNSALRRLFAAQHEDSDQLAVTVIEEAVGLFISKYAVNKYRNKGAAAK
ncbi:MAG TPA: TetR/AcrR family transcriptional regulator [Candidatus Binataceae bacterium]|nr:TetR/AcrR family transcriptional regulator [Candidatus Binataceae bacterium]